MQYRTVQCSTVPYSTAQYRNRTFAVNRWLYIHIPYPDNHKHRYVPGTQIFRAHRCLLERFDVEVAEVGEETDAVLERFLEVRGFVHFHVPWKAVYIMWQYDWCYIYTGMYRYRYASVPVFMTGILPVIPIIML